MGSIASTHVYCFVANGMNPFEVKRRGRNILDYVKIILYSNGRRVYIRKAELLLDVDKLLRTLLLRISEARRYELRQLAFFGWSKIVRAIKFF